MVAVASERQLRPQRNGEDRQPDRYEQYPEFDAASVLAEPFAEKQFFPKLDFRTYDVASARDPVKNDTATADPAELFYRPRQDARDHKSAALPYRKPDRIVRRESGGCAFDRFAIGSGLADEADG